MRKTTKKLLVPFGAFVGIALLSSMIFNFPIPFRHVPRFAPNSQNPVHVATQSPDNILLTPVGDMATEIRITWRTAESVPDGAVQFADGKGETRVEGRNLHSIELASDSTVKFFTASLSGLAPGTAYRYRVGSPSLGKWSEYRTFTTAPAAAEPFSFVYFGDTQSDTEKVGGLLAFVEELHPDAAFHMIGGDIVDSGGNRNLYDVFMAISSPTFSRVPLAPAMGNHDYERGDGTTAFAHYFGLSTPETSDTIESYSFRRGNAFFAVINTPDAADQAEWLEQELQKARAARSDFITVMFHEPVYHPRRHRSSPGAQKYLVPLFEKYGVDLVLTGHDHSYLRSKPIGTAGTVHIVATSCGKFYKSQEVEVAERQIEDIATYQVITLGADKNGRPLLRYRAYSLNGDLVDTFETVK